MTVCRGVCVSVCGRVWQECQPVCACGCVCVTHHKPLQVTVTKASLMKTTQKLTTPPSSMVYDIALPVHQLSTVLQLSALETQLVSTRS